MQHTTVALSQKELLHFSNEQIVYACVRVCAYGYNVCVCVSEPARCGQSCQSEKFVNIALVRIEPRLQKKSICKFEQVRLNNNSVCMSGVGWNRVGWDEMDLSEVVKDAGVSAENLGVRLIVSEKRTLQPFFVNGVQ